MDPLVAQHRDDGGIHSSPRSVPQQRKKLVVSCWIPKIMLQKEQRVTLRKKLLYHLSMDRWFV